MMLVSATATWIASSGDGTGHHCVAMSIARLCHGPAGSFMVVLSYALTKIGVQGLTVIGESFRPARRACLFVDSRRACGLQA